MSAWAAHLRLAALAAVAHIKMLLDFIVIGVAKKKSCIITIVKNCAKTAFLKNLMWWKVAIGKGIVL